MIYKVIDIDKNDSIVELQNDCFKLGIEERFIYEAKEKFEFGCLMVKLNHPIFKKVMKKDDFDFKTFEPIFNLIAYEFRWSYDGNEMRRDIKDKPELNKTFESKWLRFLNKELDAMLKSPNIVFNLMMAYGTEREDKTNVVNDTTRLNIDITMYGLMDRFGFNESECKMFEHYFETGELR